MAIKFTVEHDQCEKKSDARSATKPSKTRKEKPAPSAEPVVDPPKYDRNAAHKAYMKDYMRSYRKRKPKKQPAIST